MLAQTAGKTFLGILRSHLRQEPVKLPEAPDWEGIAALASMHSLQAMVWYTVKDLPGIPEQVQQKLRAGFHATVFAEAQQTYLRQRIGELFDAQGLDYIFLRGSCLKDAYPEPALRSMSDVDVLVRMENYDAIHQCMTAMGAETSLQDDNHRNYRYSGALVEFHPNLLRHTSAGAAALNPGWQFVSADAPHVLDPNGEYLYTLCHLAHHFMSGGTGVRSVMDVWVSLTARPLPDRAWLEEKLADSGLLSFVCNVEDLARAWFGDGEMTPLLQELEHYILTCGTYGTADRAFLNNAAVSGGKWTGLRKKVFPGRAVLEDTCPWSKGKPLLLPAAWVARLWHKSTADGGAAVKRWGNDAMQVEKEAVQSHSQMLRRFGLELSE